MMKWLVCLSAFAVLVCCNRKNDYDKIFSNPLLYASTVHQLNTVVMGNNFSPIVASRNYLYANVAAYEVMAAGNAAKYKSLSEELNGMRLCQNKHCPV